MRPVHRPDGEHRGLRHGDTHAPKGRLTEGAVSVRESAVEFGGDPLGLVSVGEHGENIEWFGVPRPQQNPVARCLPVLRHNRDAGVQNLSRPRPPGLVDAEQAVGQLHSA